MNIIINPGSGPVPGAVEENAVANIEAFAQEVTERYKVPVTNIVRAPEIDDGEGRFGFKLAMADGRWISIEMPGLAFEEVRYTGEDAQNIWDYPRLYVDGGSWVWKYAVECCERDDEAEL